MKRIAITLSVLLLVLSGCDKTDEHAKLKAEVDQVYQDSEVKKHAEPKRVGDVENGKKLAEKCQRCHGLDGVAAHSGAPFIAGLQQSYFVASMLGYRDGSRQNPDMRQVASALSPVEIADVSAYYSNLDTSWHGDHVGTSRPTRVSMSKENIAQGAFIAERCNSCHGPNGNNIKDREVAALAGMPPEYFIYALNTYFNGQREHQIMKVFKLTMDKKTVEQLAAYYAVQEPHKPVPPSQGNAAKGAVLAAAQCAGCHGVDGNVLNPEIPSLAAQPAEYLVKAMSDYRSGARKEKLMRGVMKNVSPAAIADLAAFYAKQKPESYAQRKNRVVKTFDPIQEGQKIAASCNGCHGKDGNSTTVGVPSLTGLSIRYFVAAAAAYRDGKRDNAMMKKAVAYLSDTEIEQAAFYYGMQTPVNNKTVTYDLNSGEKLAAGCTSCHGEKGVSKDGKTPSIAGQDPTYLATALREYASGKRPSDAMKTPASELKSDALAAVAGYFAAQKAERPNNLPPETPSVAIVQKCDRCHGDDGDGRADPAVPRLAGQSEAYLALAMKEYQEGIRKDKYMSAMSDVLSLNEIKGIAAYYAKQRVEKVE